MRRTRPRLLVRFLMVSGPAPGLPLAMSPAASASMTPKSAAAQAVMVARQALEHLSLHAGDRITACVVRSGASYTLKVTDSSRSADSFPTTQACSSCANSSAEWIAEAPSGSSGVYPLSDFGGWTESGATVKAGSASGVISSFTDDELTMINSSGATKAQPGALNSSGDGFGVT